MSDLQSSRLIVAKGVMFLVIACMSAYLALEEAPTLKMATLLVLLAWASARFYYFMFYVLERYVDPTMRYSGILNLVVTIGRRRKLEERLGAQRLGK